MKNIISNYVSLTLRSTGAAKLEFEASEISEVELREVNSTGPNATFTVDDVEIAISKVKTETEKPKIDKRKVHLKTPKRSKRSNMEKKTIKNTTVKFVSRKRAKKGQKNCAEKRQKFDVEKGTWSKKSRQLCLNTFKKYCNLSSGERYRKIQYKLAGKRTLSKFCLVIIL